MSKSTDIPNVDSYSSTVRKVLNVTSLGAPIDKFEVNLDTLNIDKINITDFHTDSESLKATVINVSQNKVFAQDVKEVIIENTSDSDIIYVNLKGGTATTDNFELYGKQSMVINKKIVAATGISLLSSNASGTVVKMEGLFTPEAA